MKITYNNAKEFVLTSEEEIFLGSLKMEKWSSSKAQVTTQYGDFYDIEKKGFWGTSIVVIKNSVEFAELKMNWKGQQWMYPKSLFSQYHKNHHTGS